MCSYVKCDVRLSGIHRVTSTMCAAQEEKMIFKFCFVWPPCQRSAMETAWRSQSESQSSNMWVVWPLHPFKCLLELSVHQYLFTHYILKARALCQQLSLGKFFLLPTLPHWNFKAIYTRLDTPAKYIWSKHHFNSINQEQTTLCQYSFIKTTKEFVQTEDNKLLYDSIAVTYVVVTQRTSLQWNAIQQLTPLTLFLCHIFCSSCSRFRVGGKKRTTSLHGEE